MNDDVKALVERLRNGPIHIGRASGAIIEMKQAADALTAQAEEIEQLTKELDACMKTMARLTSNSEKLIGESRRARREAVEDSAKIAEDYSTDRRDVTEAAVEAVTSIEIAAAIRELNGVKNDGF